MRYICLAVMLFLAREACGETRSFQAMGACPVVAEEGRGDAVRIAFQEATRLAQDRVAACLDSLEGGPEGGLSRAEVRAFVSGMVEVKRAATFRVPTSDSVWSAGECEVDPEALKKEIGLLGRHEGLVQDLIVGQGERDRLWTLLQNQSHALAREHRDRLAGLRRNTLADLEASILLARARVRFESSPLDATALIDSALSVAPQNPVAHLQKGILLQVGGNLRGAIAHYREAILLKPQDASARFNLAEALVEAGHPDSAVAEFEQAIQVRPDDAEIHYRLATVLRRLGEPDSALAAYRRALQIAPGYIRARADLGAALHSLGDLDSAIVQYRIALTISPNDPEVRYNLGTALKDVGNLEAAEEELRKALELRPDFADAHFNLGTALAARGDRPGALREMRTFIRLCPDEDRRERAREVIRAFGGIP